MPTIYKVDVSQTRILQRKVYRRQPRSLDRLGATEKSAADATVARLLDGLQVARDEASLKGFDQPIRFIRLRP